AGREADTGRGAHGDCARLCQPDAQAGCRAGHTGRARGPYPPGRSTDRNKGLSQMTSKMVAPEVKADAGGYATLSDAFDDFMTTFTQFRDDNDRRLREIE